MNSGRTMGCAMVRWRSSCALVTWRRIARLAIAVESCRLQDGWQLRGLDAVDLEPREPLRPLHDEFGGW